MPQATDDSFSLARKEPKTNERIDLAKRKRCNFLTRFVLNSKMSVQFCRTNSVQKFELKFAEK